MAPGGDVALAKGPAIVDFQPGRVGLFSSTLPPKFADSHNSLASARYLFELMFSPFLKRHHFGVSRFLGCQGKSRI